MKAWLDPDRCGMGLSLLCAVHCLATPVLFGLLPALSLALHSFRDPIRPLSLVLLRMEGWHPAVVLVTVVFAAVVLLLGWHRHRRRQPLAWLVVAACAFAIGLAAPPGNGWLHAGALATGGILTALAHALNRSAARLAPEATAMPGAPGMAQGRPARWKRQCQGS
jgi:hypothetical protein